jgi:hypothetical protein
VDTSLNLKPSFSQVDTSLNLKPSFSQVDTSLNLKANLTYVDTSLNLKPSFLQVDTSLNLKANQTYVDTSLNLKANLIYVDNSLNLKPSFSQVDTSLNLKANLTYVDTSLNLKANQTYVDTSLNLKANLIYVDTSLNLKPSFTYVDTSLNLKANLIYVDSSLNLKPSFTYVDASLNLKSNIASPTFTGTVTAPKLISGDSSFNGRVDICGNIFAATATAGANTTQLATTAFVTTALSTKADLVNPTFTGNVRISDSNGMTVLLKSVGTGITLPLVSPIQLGQDIDGEAANDLSSYSVSMNSDGTIVAIGAPNNDGTGLSTDNRGHVRVYKYDVNKLTNVTDQASPDFGPVGWRRLGQDIDGEAASDQSGFSVSLSDDGTTVAMGASSNDGTTGTSTDNRGHVRIYKYDVNKLTDVTDQASPDFGPVGWRRLGQDIDGEAAGDQSRSVSLNTDGTIVAIGAITNDGTTGTAADNRGHVRVYKYQTIADTTWDNYNATNFTYDGVTNNKPIVVAGGDATPVANKFYWVQMGVDIDGETAGDQSGTSVSLSSDGTIVAIGASSNDGTTGTSTDNRGHVRVYKYDVNKLTSITDQNSADFGPIGWRRLGQDIDGEAALDQSGRPVSLSADGTIVAIGANLNDGTPVGADRGHVRIYKYDVNKLTNVTDQASPDFGPVGWRRLGQDIDGEAASDQSGFSVSLSADGLTVAIGAYNNDGTTGSSTDNRGHVRIYKYDGISWNQLLVDIDGEAAGDQSGFSVSLSKDGTTVAIGAITNDGTTGTSSDNRGHVRVYQIQSVASTKLQISNQVEINGLTIGSANADISTNSVIGYQSLNANTSGFQNSAFGYQALLFNTSGANNTAIGYQAGDANTTGSNNTFLGSLADISGTTATWSNSTAIGYNAKITASNQITLGTATETVRVPGMLSITGDSSFNGRVDISGVLSVTSTLNTNVKNTTINNYNVSVTNDLSLNGSLLVSSDVSLNSKLYVKGEASFNGNVGISGEYLRFANSYLRNNATNTRLEYNVNTGYSHSQRINDVEKLAIKDDGNGSTLQLPSCQIREYTPFSWLYFNIPNSWTYKFAFNTNSALEITDSTDGIRVTEAVSMRNNKKIIWNEGFVSEASIRKNTTTTAFEYGVVTGYKHSWLVNNVERMSLGSNLNVLSDISLNGNIRASGQVIATNFNATSDYRIKDYVTSLSDCSFTIDMLRPVSYHNTVTDKPDIGLIAHEVQEHFPFLVTGEKDGDTIQSVNYTSLISLLIHEIQQLKQETIPKLNQTIKSLEDRIQMLES